MSTLARHSAMRALAMVGILSAALTAKTANAECDKDSINVGSRLPELKGAVDGNNKSFSIKSIKGWTFLTVGAEWCAPCKKELPAWDKIAPEFKGKITFVAVNINHDMKDGKRFNEKLKLKNMNLVYMNEDKAGSLALTMPSTFIADPKGIVRIAHCGFEKQDVDGEVKKMRADLAKLVDAK
ncbi:MAG TPA: TlpA disulfide reductase family protein [Kofleriaceae bacterium]|nr:TlpA disulfide reductase family protein [Kofleriaceae bacterium]